MDLNKLREKAIARLENANLSKSQNTDIKKLIEELHIHQVELQIQNDELKDSINQQEFLKNEYKNLFDNAPIGYVIIDKDKNILQINQAMLMHIGVNPFVAKKSKITKYIAPESQNIFHFYINNLISKINTDNSCEVKIVSGNNEITLQVEADIHKSKNEIRLVFTDITKQKELQEKYLEEKEKAEKANKIKSTFLSNISHEIRTPMNAILGFSKLINDENINEEKKATFLSIINNATENLLGLFNELVDLSVIQSGNYPVSLKEINLQEFITDIYKEFHIKTAENTNIEIILEVPEDNKPKTVITDPDKLREILKKLLDNSLKFTSIGSIVLGFNYSDNAYTIYVSDTGIGIHVEEIDDVFNPFYQSTINLDLTSSKPGVGLGLSVAKGLTELLSGKISISSKEGYGTSVKLKFNHLNDKSNLKVSNTNKNINEIDSILNNKTCLIVEDNPYNMLFFEEYIGQYNTLKYTASNGNDALSLLELHKSIDFILLDIKLPDISGIEIIKRVRVSNKTIKIIAVSASAHASNKIEVLEAGADYFLAKPVTPEQLSQTLVNILKI